MKCQNLFSGKNKNISVCNLLKIIAKVLSVNLSKLNFFIVLFQASEICNDTGDRAACYHLARQLENQDQIKEAIHFFQRAEAYGNAIRLCKVCSKILSL